MHSIKIVCFIALLVVFLHNNEAAKILGVFPIPASSHYNLYRPLLKAMHDKGHEITVITAFEEKTPKVGYREIVLDGFLAKMTTLMDQMNPFVQTDPNPYLHTFFLIDMMLGMSEDMLKNPKVQTLLHSGETFDLIIIEQFGNSEHRTFGEVFKAPVIILSTVGANAWINGPEGNPAPPSYIPEVFLGLPRKMSFLQRVTNSLYNAFNQVLFQYYTVPKEIALVKKYVPGAPNFYDALYNVSLVLLNSHFSINQAVPYTPNMIDIGGFHINPPKALPDNLQQFLDQAVNGVVYFSLGSNAKSAKMPVEKRNAIINVFSRLKLQVLWKFEDEILPNQPKNVKIGKWLPQSDLLAHKNIKLFISHGGLLSTTESIYHGVPMLAIPLFGDQKMNAKIVVDSGFGLTINFADLTEESLETKIKELLENRAYKEVAQYRSKVFHDRLVKPLDTAVYWMEYVIRHKGAPHLKVAAAGMPSWKYFLVDVIAFVVGVIFISTFIVVLLIRKVLKIKCSAKEKKVKRN